MGETFAVNRIALRKILTLLGVGEKSINQMESTLNKSHKHVNAVAFSGILQRMGLKQDEIKNVLRKIGIDDVTITNILDMLDEEKINETFGKVVDLDIR